MTGLSLDELDRDGALRTAFERIHGRADFLRGAVVGGGALAAALAAPPLRAMAQADDVGVLNFDLTFEYMQASFYTEAERIGTVDDLPPRAARWARVFGAHERAHVKILKDVLGRDAVGKPVFDFQGVTEDTEEFTRTVVAMEDLTTALLSGQIPRLRSRPLIAAVFSLLTVEARHAAWVRHVSGFLPVADAFDDPRSLRDVGEVVRATNFIASRARTRARGRPRFTG